MSATMVAFGWMALVLCWVVIAVGVVGRKSDADVSVNDCFCFYLRTLDQFSIQSRDDVKKTSQRVTK